MREMTFNRIDLIKRITENREEHAKIVAEAQKGYRETVIRELDKHLAAAKEGKQVPGVIQFRLPENHTADYDAVLDMLHMTTDATILLEEETFRQYVRDEWHWQRQFLMNNSLYSATATAKLQE